MDRTEELRQWFSISNDDLKTAEHLANNMHPVPEEIVCFHCQQSIEKDLKGYLLYNSIVAPKIHDLTGLLELCEKANANFASLLEKCNYVNKYSVLPRYPHELQITSNDVKLALRYAKDIKQFVLSLVDSSVIEEQGIPGLQTND
jgi:HEPN domain-containing protein